MRLDFSRCFAIKEYAESKISRGEEEPTISLKGKPLRSFRAVTRADECGAVACAHQQRSQLLPQRQSALTLTETFDDFGAVATASKVLNRQSPLRLANPESAALFTSGALTEEESKQRTADIGDILDRIKCRVPRRADAASTSAAATGLKTSCRAS